MSWRRPARADGLAVVALVVVSLALHARFLAGQAPVGWDLTAPFAPYQREVNVWNGALSDVPTAELPSTELHARGGPAAWNPYTALGQPSGVLTPPFRHYPPAAVLHALAPPWVAKGLGSLLHVLLGGVAMYGWLRWRGLGARAALIGAIAFQLAPMNTRWLQFSARTVLTAWAPLVLWGAEVTARSGALRHAALTGAALAAATLGGFSDQTAVLLFLLAAAVLLLGSAKRWPRARVAGLVLTALGFGVALSAVRLVPAVLELSQAERARIPWSVYFDSTVRLGPRHLLLALLPDALGGPLRGVSLLGAPGERYANSHEVVLYVGLPVLALALAGVRRRARTVGLAALAGLALVLAFPTPLGWVLWAFVPGFSASAPVRVLWVVSLVAPVLAASGAQALLAGSRRPLAIGAGIGAVVVTLAAFVASPGGVARLLPAHIPPAQRERLAEGLSRDVLRFTAPGLEPVGAPRPLQGVRGEGRAGVLLSPSLGPVLLAAALLAALGLARWRRRAGASALVGVLVFELLHHGISYNPTSRPGELFRPTPTLERVRQVAGEGRVLLDRDFFPNLLTPFQVREVGGYTSSPAARTTALLSALAGRHPLQQLLAPLRLPPRWRDALAVRAVLTGPGREPSLPDGLVLDRQGEDLTVWINPGALPRARVLPAEAVIACPDRAAALEVVSDPRRFDPTRQVALESPPPLAASPPGAEPGTASIEVDEPERVEVRVDAPAGGVLLLADAWTDGWSVTDERGAPLAAVPADVALRGVVLPAGFSGRVVWTYAPPGQGAGALVSAAGALMLLVTCVLRRR